MDDQELEFDLRNVFAVLRRQLRLIIMTVVVILAVALIYVLSATPMYRAEALVLVDPSEQNLLDPSQSSSSAAGLLNSRVESEVEILRSAATALAMVQAANLIQDPEFGPRLSTSTKLMRAIGLQTSELPDGEALLKQVIADFMDARDVRRRGLTFVISVGVTSENPERAATLANTLAETYIAQQVAAKVTSALRGRDVLQSQVASAQTRLALSEGRLDNFIFDNLDRLEAESGEEAIAALREQLDSAQSLQQARQALSADAQGALASRDWTSLTSALQDDALSELNRERENLERRLGNAAEGSPLALDLRAALDDVEAGLENEANIRLAALQAEVRGFEDQIGSVRDDIRTTLLRSNLSSNTLAEVFTLQQEAELSRNQYQTLLTRLSDLETQASVQIADSRIVSQALPPSDPSFPNKPLILAVALVGALALGFGLAFANEYYVGGVTSESQLANILQSRVVGVVPAQVQERGTHSVADVIVDQPLSAYSEAFRQLRASIDQTLRKRPKPEGVGHVILVSSAVPAEGKSTSALSLARTYALSGLNTLLIDADLRKPSLARQMGIQAGSSLLQYLSVDDVAEASMSFFSQDPKSPLFTLTGESRSEIPTDQLVLSPRFQNMLDDASKHSDIVIIDSPPIVPVVDARYVAHRADLVLLVARFASTTQTDIRAAAEQIRSACNPDTPVLGLLSHEERPEKSYRYQGYYSDYTT